MAFRDGIFKVTECTKPRVNRVTHYHDQSRWGMSDRLSLLNSLGKVAETLCACINIDLPAYHLTSLHNHGNRIPYSTKWDAYFNLTFASDHTPALCKPHARTNMTQSHLVSNSATHTVSNFTAALELASAGTAIDWTTSISSCGSLREYVSRLSPQPHGELVVSWSPITYALADALSKEASLRSGFDFVHIRRTDRARFCNTSAVIVNDVLRCTFQQRGLNRTLPLVVFTDETDTAYLSALTRALRPSFHRGILLGDSILRKTANDLQRQPQRDHVLIDNYVIYNAIGIVEGRARFGIKFSGGPGVGVVCPKCKEQSVARYEH